jgi:8-oxo-dGTP pyrophosphatase MutT (NUDIX family)
MKQGQIRTIVLGIFRDAGRLLVFEGHDPGDGATFYRPLGGGIEFGEYGDQTLMREMHEELGAEITDVRYLGAIQSIFIHAGKQGHEIVLVYAARFVDPRLYDREIITDVQDDGVPLRVLWKPLLDFQHDALLVPAGLLELLLADHPA